LFLLLENPPVDHDFLVETGECPHFNISRAFLVCYHLEATAQMPLRHLHWRSNCQSLGCLDHHLWTCRWFPNGPCLDNLRYLISCSAATMTS
jgi:hypothetical protein